jgi:hypothetical protein
MSTLRRCVLVGLLTACTAVSGSACYVEELPPPVYADGYQPQFYDGYVVYYDDVGTPFYYQDGVAVWVPRASPLYGVYVNHWHTYGFEYRNWYAHHGHRYRSYQPGRAPGRGGGFVPARPGVGPPGGGGGRPGGGGGHRR